MLSYQDCDGAHVRAKSSPTHVTICISQAKKKKLQAFKFCTRTQEEKENVIYSKFLVNVSTYRPFTVLSCISPSKKNIIFVSRELFI